MANSPTLVPRTEGLKPHLELKRAHLEAARIAALLHEDLEHALEIDLANTQKQAIELAVALERVAISERACGSCDAENHVFGEPYKEMLEQHRLAFIDFTQLSQKLEGNLRPRCSDIARLALDIERHLNTAEKAHDASIQSASEKKSR